MTVQHSPAGRLGPIFDACRAEGRAALIGYLPAGFPTVDGAVDAIRVMVENGVDVVEMHDLLEQTVALPEAKKWLLDNRVTANEVGLGLMDEVRSALDAGNFGDFVLQFHLDRQRGI